MKLKLPYKDVDSLTTLLMDAEKHFEAKGDSARAEEAGRLFYLVYKQQTRNKKHGL